jgi:SAM-dependent methyltransferase
MKEDEIKKRVREGYGRIASQGGSCCLPQASCCGGVTSLEDLGRQMGYSEEELKAAPEGSNLGLGCGNPLALASLKAGETVLDLGSGAGFDCFLAARQVGESGRVIGVDMTPEMIEKAKENARRGGFPNVEFRLGEIEKLPVPDGSVDIVLSNCVINLSPDKAGVFREAFRVLKPGGRLMISDIVLLKPLPEAVLKSVGAYLACVSGAILKNEYLGAIQEAGFEELAIMEEIPAPVDLIQNDPLGKTLLEDLGLGPENIKEGVGSVVSIKVRAFKPRSH